MSKHTVEKSIVQYYNHVILQIKLDDGWPETEAEHSDNCMYRFHHRRSLTATTDVAMWRYKEAKMRRTDLDVRKCENSLCRCENVR